MDLPPLDFSKEVEEYKAFEEKKEVNFPACKHRDTKIVDGWLRCKCGNSWTAPASVLVELQKALCN